MWGTPHGQHGGIDYPNLKNILALPVTAQAGLSQPRWHCYVHVEYEDEYQLLTQNLKPIL